MSQNERPYTLFDDKVVKDIVSGGQEYEDANKRMGNLETMKARNARLLLETILMLSQEDNLHKRMGDQNLEANKARKAEAKIRNVLEDVFGHSTADKLSRHFVQTAERRGFDKAARLFVGEVAREGKKHAGAGKSHGEIGLFNGRGREISRLNRTVSKIQRPVQRSSSKAHKADKGIMETRSKIVQKAIHKNASKSGLDKKQQKQLSAEERKTKKIISRQIQLEYLIAMRMRDMRRAARKMRSTARNIELRAEMNNKIELSPRGEMAADELGVSLDMISRYVEMGQDMVGHEHRPSESQNMSYQVEQLLRSGQQAMISAQSKTAMMQNSLVKTRQMEQERQRQRV